MLLSCPILLPKQLLSQAAMLFALTVLHRSAKFRLVMRALFLIQSNPHNSCSIFVSRLFAMLLVSLCCTDGDQESSQLHISVGALLKNRQFLSSVLFYWLLTLPPYSIQFDLIQVCSALHSLFWLMVDLLVLSAFLTYQVLSA